MTGTKLRQALTYAARGWPVFPCQAGQKTPATAHGHRRPPGRPGRAGDHQNPRFCPQRRPDPHPRTRLPGRSRRPDMTENTSPDPEADDLGLTAEQWYDLAFAYNHGLLEPEP